MQTTAVGSYPKIPNRPRPARLRRAIARFDRGEITAEELARVEDEVTIEVIGEQTEAGLDIVTDGQVRWDDDQTYIARRLEGFEIGGILKDDFLVGCVERVGENGAQGDPKQPGDDPAPREKVPPPSDAVDQGRNVSPTSLQRTIQHGFDREVVDQGRGDLPVQVSQAIQGADFTNRVEAFPIHPNLVPGETRLTQARGETPSR